MPDTRKCPQCGTELPGNAPAGVCPKCLLEAGLADDTDVREHRSDEAPTTPLPHSSRFSPPPPHELARHFPQLEILELIGAGGMGAVYKARQPGLDRFVAIKILPPEVGVDPSFAQRFTREAQALARLGHQHIVSVFDFGVAGGLYYFIMEYVDGANLRHLIKSGSLKPEEALAVVPQICEALQFAHDEGVVHRDIKPENILVDKRGRVKIADFGLARLLGAGAPEVSLTGTNQVLGTLHYMAPEQIQGLRTVDHRADIYSLGVVFYEMLTGELPLGRFAPPSQKVEVDVRLDEVVLRSLESEPIRRYQRAGDVKTDVESISQLPPRAQTPPSKINIAANDEALSRVREHVRFPAVLLFITGVVTLPLVMQGLHKSIAQHGGHWSSFEFGAMETGMAWAFAVMFGIPVVMLVGAVKMLRLTSYWWAVAAGIMTFLPFSLGPLWLLSVPLGIWTLVVLSKEEVKQGFALRRQQSTREPVAQAIAPHPRQRHQHAEPMTRDVESASLDSSAIDLGRMADGLDRNADERQRAAELAERPPYWLEFGAMGLFGLGWTFAGAMWNYGLPGLWVAFAVMAAIIYGVMRWKVAYVPALHAELARQSRMRRGFALSASLVLFVLAMFFLVAAQTYAWDFFHSNVFRSFNFQEKQQTVQHAVRLARLPGLGKDAIVTPGGWGGGGAPNALPWLSSLFTGWLGFVFLSWAVSTMLDTRRYRGTWKNFWAPSLAISLACFLMLPGAQAIRTITMGLTTTTVPPLEFRGATSRDQVVSAIKRWSEKMGYAANRSWYIEVVEQQKTVGKVDVTDVWQNSPHDRYHLSWRHGVWSPRPALSIACVTTNDPVQAYVHVELPRQKVGSPEESQWPKLLDDLKAEILAAAGTESLGEAK
jgi:serine/threonine protein kinase